MTDKMTIERAREIVRSGKCIGPACPGCKTDEVIAHAKGFIECHEAREAEIAELKAWKEGKKGVEDYYAIREELWAERERAGKLLGKAKSALSFAQHGDYIGAAHDLDEALAAYQEGKP